MTAISRFNYAQTFFVDPGVVFNASTTGISAVDLYFRSKPEQTNNASGINSPGVHIFLCRTTDNNLPSTEPVNAFATVRKEYNEINVSDDASVATSFTFPYPVTIETGKKYALIIKFDGNEEFQVWTSVEGKPLVTDETINAGPAGKYIGDFYEYGNLNDIATNTSENTVTDANSLLTSDPTLNIGNFLPIKDTDLKFKIYAAKYNYDIVSNTVLTTETGKQVTKVEAKRSYLLPKKNYEFVVFDRINSTNIDVIRGGELVYQNNVLRPESIVVSNGSTLVTSSNINFSQIFNSNSNEDEYLVIFSGDNKNIRKVEQIQSNTSIIVDQPVTFSNVAARFSKVAVGTIDVANESKAFKKIEDILVIDNSNANSTLRFTNNVIESITLNDGGSGYSNSDYIVVNTGGPDGNAPEVNAIANVEVDSNGSIIATTLSNMGIGYLETPDFIILNANNDPSSGSGANLSFTVGSTLKTEISNASLTNCKFINLPLNSTRVGAFDVENPAGSTFFLKKHYLYYNTGDGIVDVAIYNGGSGYSNGTTVSFSGGGGSGANAYITTTSTGKIVDVVMTNEGSSYTSAPEISVAGGSGANLTPILGASRNNSTQYPSSFERNVALFGKYNLEYANTPVILSRSNEVTQPEIQITLETGATVNTNISSLVEMVVTSNNEFVASDILSGELDVIYSKYAINNDYTNEHTGNGRAVAKHISKKLTFSDDKSAEDIRIYFDAYRPVGTDIKVYAKIHNNKDPEPFDDKDWTLLEYKNNTQSSFSTTGIQASQYEYECGFTSYPNSEFTATGSVTTELANSTIVGSGTIFESEFANSDLVKIYSPLFPNNYVISVVESITSNTELVLRDTISNNNVVGTGFNIDKLEFKNQAFNNFLNDNVVRYYDGSMREYDNYDTVAVKLVLLSDNDSVVPKVNNIRVIGVSA